MTTALLPKLRRPGGRIILTSSIAAQRGGAGPYSAAKAALHGYALDLAVNLGAEGITANVISPGYVTGSEFFDGRMTPEGHRSRVDSTLVKRPGVPEDIAESVRWLVGPGGGYVTGQIINVSTFGVRMPPETNQITRVRHPIIAIAITSGQAVWPSMWPTAAPSAAAKVC